VTPVSGSYADTVYAKATDANADLIELSTDNVSWTAATTRTLTTTTNLYARSTIGSTVSQVATIAYAIAHDTTLKSLTVSGINVSIAGTTFGADSLPMLTTQATVTAIPKYKAARVTINGGVSTTVNLVNDAATVTILVVNGASSQSYTLYLYVKKSGTVTDRDGNVIRIGKMPDGKVWTLQNLWTNPSTASLDPNYNDGSAACYYEDCSRFPKNKYGLIYSWAMAVDKQASCDGNSCPIPDSLQHQGLCPSGWHLPTPTDWKNLISVTGNGVVTTGLSKIFAGGTNTWTSWEMDEATGNMIIADYSGTDNFGFSLYPNGMNGGSASGYDQAIFVSATTTKSGAFYYPSGILITPTGITTPRESVGNIRCTIN
jgi:uncharacterized protein (TIGR02145 family)